MEIRLLPKAKVERKSPLNLVDRDSRLFENEFIKELEATSIYAIEKAWITSDGVIFKDFIPLWNSLYHLTKAPNWKNFLALGIRQLKLKKTVSADNVFWIADNWSRNYFHWLTDALPKLFVFDGSDRIIALPESLRKVEFISESLDLLKCDVRYIDDSALVRFNKISFAENLSPSGNYREELIQNLRATLLSGFLEKFDGNEIVTPRMIYIHRNSELCRSLKNEREVYEILEKYGIEVIDFETIDWVSQLRLLMGCSILIGAHGAGLANMLFLPENAKIVELRQKGNEKDNCYFSLAGAVNLDYYYHLCDYSLFEGSDRFGIFEISDLELFDELLANVTK